MKCPECDGKGVDERGYPYELCSYCGGTGKLPNDFAEIMELKRCKKCGGKAVFSGCFDDPNTWRFPECMECGARAKGNSVDDSWEERARKWNEQNTPTNEEWFCSLSTEEKASFLSVEAARAISEYENNDTKRTGSSFWEYWLKAVHKE